MAGYRKLGRTSSQRKALLRSQVTELLYHGKIVTTEARAKELRRIAEKLITLAVKEKDNFETVTVKSKVARKDANGKNVREVVDGRKVTVFDEVEKESVNSKRVDLKLVIGEEKRIKKSEESIEELQDTTKQI